MTNRHEIGDYDGLVEALRLLIAEWRQRANDITNHVPAAREAWSEAAMTIANLLGPERHGAAVPRRPPPDTLIQQAEAKMNTRDWVGAALDLVRAIAWRDPARQGGDFDMARWDAAASRLLQIVEGLQAIDAAAAAGTPPHIET